MMKKRSEPKYRKWRRPKYGNDRKGVSEAIGTILLLAIAIILIGVVAVWVETVPQPPKFKQTNLKVTYSEISTGVVTVDILHEGGDTLNGGEIEISIIQTYPTFNNYYMDFSDSDTHDLDDDYWDIGDHWNYTLTGVQDNAEFNIKIVDINADRLLLNEDILIGKLNINLPDLLISSDNITFTYDGSSIRKDRPVKITAIIQNQGNENASAIIRFFDDNRLIISGGSEYKKVDVPYKYLPTVKNYKIVSMNWIPKRWGVHNINIKIYSLQYETNYANNYASKQVEVEYYFEPSRGPDLAISEFDILPSKTYPFHGNDLNVTIIMHNRGDQSILPGEIFNVTITLGNVTYLRQFTNGIRARDSMDFYVLFLEIGPGGPNQITVELDPDNSITELNKENNIGIRSIQILPTILLVDDDNADTGKRDVAGTMMKALKGRGITFEYYNIKGEEDPNPRINQGPRKLKNFDIVIWVTGYELNNTLTTTNKQNLKTWLDEPDTTNSLWLIGQDILNDTVAAPGVVMDTDFAYQYLGLIDYTWSSGAPEILNGIPGDTITDGMLINTSGYIPGENRALNLTLQTPDSNNRIYSILGNDSALGVNKSMGLRYQNISNSYKVVFLSFEITSISSPYDLSNLTYHVLKWFNYSLEQGYDFGVVEQEFSTVDPDFMDVITISATVVNNGPNDEEVYVMFYYTDPVGQEFEIETFPDSKDNPQKVVVPGMGGRLKLTKEWLAISVGDHNFRVMVDPFDQFKEIVEENNDFTYYGLEVTQLQIQYTILLVDDDNSSNNMAGMQPETTIQVEDALTSMGYYYIDYVVTGGDFPESGPDIDTLKHYNTVIWLTGDDPGPTLTVDDQQNLVDYITGNYIESQYLKVKVNLLLVGQNILNDLNGTGNNIVPGPGFVRDYLRINEYSSESGLPNQQIGIQDNPISHGSRYPIDYKITDKADMIQSHQNNYLFMQNQMVDTYNSLNFEHGNNHSRIVFLPWEISSINYTHKPMGAGIHETYLSEFLYMVLNWFEYPDESAELRISDIDINISYDKPNVGDSYIISTDIYNYGDEDCGTIIRYYDGNTIIDTDTVFVPKHGKTSSEIIWVPRFAGNRTINIYTDIDDDVPERFEILNNKASVRDMIVYFFYDDLEDGPKNWEHDATIIRINGESKLEYMDYPVHSNINDTWEDIEKFGINNSLYHSAQTSLYTLEPGGEFGKADILLGLVIDDSASMSTRLDGASNTWLSVAKNASRYLISLLSDNSNVTIWHFKGNNEERALQFTKLEGSGRDIVNNSISSLSNPSGTTILWDAIGEAYTDVNNAIPNNPYLSPLVIVLSDGMDIQASDRSGLSLNTANNKVEGGSNKWGAWHEMYINNQSSLGYKNAYFDRHYGKYTLDWSDPVNTTYWLEALAQGSMEHNRTGLLYADMPIYTIGLGLEHHNPVYEPIISNWPGDETLDFYNATCNDTSPNCIESGTLEYNLWRIATTSEAKYFYSPTTDELFGIFRKIATTIGAVLTRSSRAPETIVSFDFETGWQGWQDGGSGSEWERGDPSDPNIAPHGGSYCVEIDLNGNYRNSANFWLYHQINLTRYEDCYMTFWHYFEIENNYDGCCVMVSDNGGTTWSLASPTLPSSGWDTNINGNNDYNSKLGHRRGWTGDGPMGNNRWEQVTVDLSTWDGQDIIIRFWFASDSSFTDDGWAIDDITITGNKTTSSVVVNPSELLKPGNRYLTTYTFSLENTSSAKASFYHKYNLRLGVNGVVVQVGTPVGSGGTWMFQYALPKQPYSGNFDIRKSKTDDFSHEMRWCWNGISGNNLFGWEYIEVPLDNWTGLKQVKVRILFLWSEYGQNGVYMIDDFEIKVKHSDDDPLIVNSTDQWQLTTADAHSGNYSWWNGNPVTNNFTGGLDNSLYSRPIDLTNARNATLTSFFKFNINVESGRPPDGFRVEVSTDNAVNWKALNFGVRSAWGVSGNESDASDGVPNDGKSYTGIDSGDNWVEAGSLTRLNCDLEGWVGEVIRLRFRVVTASNANPYFGNQHYESATAGFGGFYIDDIIIYGVSLLEG